jgi:hypothetical protein
VTECQRLSLRARQVLTFLKQKSGAKGYCWWRQDRLARAMDCCLRTINGAIAELVSGGLVTVTRGRYCNVYTIREIVEKLAYQCGKPVESAVEILKSCVSDTQFSAHLRPPHPISESLKGKEQLACLPEGNLCGVPLASIVPPTITNEYGRVYPNPEFHRVRGILENAEERIRRANDPEAYLRAILQRELGLAAGAGRGYGAPGDPATGGSLLPFEGPSLAPAETSGTSAIEPKSLKSVGVTTTTGGGTADVPQVTRRKPPGSEGGESGAAEGDPGPPWTRKGASGGS